MNHLPDIESFRTCIWQHHREHRRAFPWRDNLSPYRVMVSEIMLQQTQTTRVLAKFESFIESFPHFSALAEAPFSEVLALWKGLGYNRRALALKSSADIITNKYQGEVPDDPVLLEELPGIGKATAASIVAFSFNKPTVFIETNIRTVFIDAFFKNQKDIHDREILPLIAASVDLQAPREWYYALMDYGVMIKQTIGNISQKSSHYKKQSRFEGSNRQIRGLILEALLAHTQIPRKDLPSLLEKDEVRVNSMLTDLCTEGLVRDQAGTIVIC